MVAEPELDHKAVAEMRRVFPKQVPLSKKERKRLRKLEARYKTLYDRYPDGDVPTEVAAKLERIEAAVESLNKQEYAACDRALAGAFITLAHDGSVHVERGFVRPEDDPQSKAKAEDQKGKRPAKNADGLVAELTAYRTSALRNELAKHPATAYLALVHALALDLFYPGQEGSMSDISIPAAISAPTP